jgi:hypothetical protein
MVAEVFGPDGLIVLLVFVAPLALAIFCTVDVAKQPALTSGQKSGWIIGFWLGSLLFGIVGLLVSIVYLAGVRPKLEPLGQSISKGDR